MTDQAATFDTARTELLRDEGKVLTVYDDTTGRPLKRGAVLVGYATLGVGRNLTVNGISDAESEVLLLNDQSSCWEELSGALPWFTSLSPGRAAGLICLYFNVGEHNPRGFVATWPRLMTQLKTKDWAGAGNNVEYAQPYASQVGSRAKRIADMLRFG